MGNVEGKQVFLLFSVFVDSNSLFPQLSFNLIIKKNL